MIWIGGWEGDEEDSTYQGVAAAIHAIHGDYVSRCVSAADAEAWEH